MMAPMSLFEAVPVIRCCRTKGTYIRLRGLGGEIGFGGILCHCLCIPGLDYLISPFPCPVLPLLLHQNTSLLLGSLLIMASSCHPSRQHRSLAPTGIGLSASASPFLAAATCLTATLQQPLWLVALPWHRIRPSVP